MGIYIKGMKMPRCCGDGCDFLEPMGLKCLRTHKFLDREDYRYERPEDCPLVEVSESHGRLIDESNVKDAIYERLKVLQTHEVFRRKRGDIDLLGILPYIDKIPTVIPREGGE